MNAGEHMLIADQTEATRELTAEIRQFRADLAAFTKLVSTPLIARGGPTESMREEMDRLGQEG